MSDISREEFDDFKNDILELLSNLSLQASDTSELEESDPRTDEEIAEPLLLKYAFDAYSRTKVTGNRSKQVQMDFLTPRIGQKYIKSETGVYIDQRKIGAILIRMAKDGLVMPTRENKSGAKVDYVILWRGIETYNQEDEELEEVA